MKEDSFKRRYFAASNSSGGFVNYFPRIFGEGRCRRLFVIKGGPGTGKSSFMRRMGTLAEQMGYDVTYYLCSSDPASLDGILIDGLSVGFVDGTAPHVWEPASVGAFEEIVNLGAFWDGDALAKKRDEIEALNQRKRNGYRRAYRYLAAYGELLLAAEAAVLPLVDRNKLSRAAERIFRRYAPPPSARPEETVGICDSVGMTGRVRLDTYERLATLHCPIRDFGGTAHLFLEELYSLCRKEGVSTRVSYDPILPQRIEALAFVENGVTFSLCERDEDDRTVNMRRFVDVEGYRAIRGGLRECNALGERLLTLANGAFSEVREYHFLLETIFGNTMDFAEKERFQERFANSLFGISS